MSDISSSIFRSGLFLTAINGCAVALLAAVCLLVTLSRLVAACTFLIGALCLAACLLITLLLAAFSLLATSFCLLLSFVAACT